MSTPTSVISGFCNRTDFATGQSKSLCCRFRKIVDYQIEWGTVCGDSQPTLNTSKIPLEMAFEIVDTGARCL